MNGSRFGQIAALLLSLIGLLVGAATVDAAESPSETVRDFMIQNVCLDRSRTVVEQISPVDGDRNARLRGSGGEREKTALGADGCGGIEHDGEPAGGAWQCSRTS